jgi:DNA-binding NtrC family response regulator
MTKIPNALVIDDEAAVNGFVAEVLRSDGWSVTEALNAAAATEALQSGSFELIFCDVLLGDADGYELLRRFRDEMPEARFVMMTGHGSAAGALDATAIGAFDYLVKPFSVADVLRISGIVREQLQIRRRSDKSTEIPAAGGYTSDIPLIGRSAKFVECLKMVGRVAPTSLPVLITGESGTGKELIANAIHRRSRRSGGPFVTVNCGAIPTELIESELFGHSKGSFTGATTERIGLWEEASGGTLFLDEITETAPQFQVKLLRALQEGEIRRVGSNKTIRVDARVIGATNRDIEAEVMAGRFRQDLMYRLNAVTIHIPPLRERAEDIPLLAFHFAEKAGGEHISFAEETLALLKAYPWPGNVRELENAILHSVSMADDVIYPEHLPVRVSGFGRCDGVAHGLVPEEITQNSLKNNERLLTLAEMEAHYVEKVLASTGGNKQAAARILGIDRKTLSRILARKMNHDTAPQ